MALLNDRAFSDLIKILEIDDPMNSNDPDRRVIEKSFRKLALKTHPDKGGDPMKFKKINDAYNRLIQHISKLEIIESDKELTTTSVIIEISKQAISKWIEKLKVYGIPRTSNFKSTLFEGPYKHYKGRSRSIGPISITLYEEPQDGIPKVHIRCENYMLWIQEQKLPLHLHVNKNKKIMFDQWRIMNVAEFGFVSSSIYSKGSCVAAYKQWSEEFESNKRSQNNEDPKLKPNENIDISRVDDYLQTHYPAERNFNSYFRSLLIRMSKSNSAITSSFNVAKSLYISFSQNLSHYTSSESSSITS
ncbi:DNAJA2 [Lepeophtheirus salmonis]|uniref:DNAJA2 n=1 Tax=Lepeophtheirus salmonis TaxID=72036 RepID=A0A7R8CL84_LEPSM|nr:DNAJA2 [Lepeophtheirus salmonis]CAF2820667.1 DNAJA2 [Lepeophtheirus salmonis]